ARSISSHDLECELEEVLSGLLCDPICLVAHDCDALDRSTGVQLVVPNDGVETGVTASLDVADGLLELAIAVPGIPVVQQYLEGQTARFDDLLDTPSSGGEGQTLGLHRNDHFVRLLQGLLQKALRLQAPRGVDDDEVVLAEFADLRQLVRITIDLREIERQLIAPLRPLQH